jgi:hypothetical protein
MDFGADLAENKLSLTIEAIDYHTFAKQLVVFEQDERIKKTNFSEVNLETSGRVGSSLEIELEPNFIRQQNE